MKKIFLAIAAVGMMLTACNVSEVADMNQSGNRIGFRTTTGYQTKALDVTTANLPSFVVEAFDHETVTSPYFSAITFTKDAIETDIFDSSEPYYWPEGALDFYAYAWGAAASSQFSKTDFRTFTITPAETPAEQIDFVYACNTNLTKAGSTAGKVPLNFRHAESKVIVKVKNTAPNLKFQITDWRIGFVDKDGVFTYNSNETHAYDATTNGSGTLNVAMWSGNGEATAAKKYDFTLANPMNVAASASTAVQVTDATVANGEMILIPQSVTAASAYANSGTSAVGDLVDGSYIALKIKIMNDDNSTVIYSDGSNGTAWAIWPAPVSFEPGKLYTYTIDLAGGGYYETNHDTDPELDPILEGARIRFASVTVDTWNVQANTDLTNSIL